MTLRIKEICKEKGITMAELAEKLGISAISLSQCLSGNPTMKRLVEISEILGVDVTELFAQKQKKEIQGCIFIDGEANVIRTKQDLENVLEKLGDINS